MARMIVVYSQPADPAAFNRHYREVHVPLATQLPGLLSYRINAGPVTGRFDAGTPYRIGILEFASMDALKQAFASEIGQQCAADRAILAPNDGDSVMYIFDEDELFEGAQDHDG